MNDHELVELIYLLFGVGIVMEVYYPGAWGMLVQLIALLGAFYLLWGIFARMISFVTTKPTPRKEDWWNGIAILLLVLLIFGETRIPFKTIQLLFDAASSVLSTFA